MWTTVLAIILWLGWAMLAAAGALLALFMTAFGDEPRTNLAVRRAITPLVLWIGLGVIGGGIALMNRGDWWAVLLAYALALSPPVLLYGLMSVLMAYGGRK